MSGLWSPLKVSGLGKYYILARIFDVSGYGSVRFMVHYLNYILFFSRPKQSYRKLPEKEKYGYIYEEFRKKNITKLMGSLEKKNLSAFLKPVKCSSQHIHIILGLNLA